MATNKCVNVLAPNGRRQTVKVTPNTTILQILEEVCIKQGFRPEDYDIKHHRTRLDTTSTIRFSGIPNNAQLELQEATKERTESDVVLVVQTEDGKRHQGNFSPTTNIWDILSNLCPGEARIDSNPVVIYMRLEIYGMAKFQSTTLRSLGLTSGRALFRLIHKSPEELRVQANVSAPLPSKPTEEKQYIRQYKPLESKSPKTSREPSPKATTMAQADPKPGPSGPSKFFETDAQGTAASSKYAQPPLTNTNLLNMLKQEKRKANDKKQVVHTVDEKEEKDGTREGKNRAGQDDFVFLGMRNAMIFSLETAQTVRNEDLPDDFFELTIEDAKRLMGDIKRRRHQLENGHLQTHAMRSLEENKRQLRQLAQYKSTVIRVQFPDRTVLQGCFKPIETIGVVQEFVREYLEDGSIDFYLFTTPPKAVLPSESRLLEVGCVPGALLHFGSNQMCESYLKQNLLVRMTSSSIASMAASKLRRTSSRPITEISSSTRDITEDLAEEEDIEDPGALAGPSHYEDYDRAPQTKAPEKFPKWFKPT